jgi:dTDP-4-amino-4,6-dideoxyglucose formyltransferase
MKKIFVVTDNVFIYGEFKEIIDVREDAQVDYFCSPKSEHIFKKEIQCGKIKTLLLKKNENFIIDNYDLGISCHSKQVFPSSIVQSKLCINIHPGLNPFNRGWYPQVFSIINKMPAGATIHIMDEEIDHGDIVIQEEIRINNCDNSLDAYTRIQAKEIELLTEIIDSFLLEELKTRKPSSEGNYNSISDYQNMCKIDLNKKVTMKEAIDFLRAMTHPPYKNSFFLDENNKKVFVSLHLEIE